MKKRKKYTRNKSILFIPNSKNKSNKVIYSGRKGKDCVFFNPDLFSCKCRFSMNYKQLCHSHKCKEYKHK